MAKEATSSLVQHFTVQHPVQDLPSSEQGLQYRKQDNLCKLSSESSPGRCLHSSEHGGATFCANPAERARAFRPIIKKGGLAIFTCLSSASQTGSLTRFWYT